MIRSSTILALVATLAAWTGSAAAQSRIQAGVLECRGLGSTGFIIGSVQEFECVFRSDLGILARYRGMVRKLGVDLGFTEQSFLAWGVFAPVKVLGPGDLTGNYAGAQGSATLGVGAGGNVLVGGSNNSIALQPLSLQGQIGVSVAAGLESLELRPGR